MAILAMAPGAGAQTKFKTLYKFTGGQDGGVPVAGLIFDQAGNLYGTTLEGGVSNSCVGGCGVVFKLAPNADGSWSETVIGDFGGGEQTAAGVIFDQAGNLYGTTQGGGPAGAGTVFKLTPTSYATLYSFCLFKNCNDGSLPLAGLIFDQAGNLYGTTAEGGSTSCGPRCGVVFQLSPSANGIWTEKVLRRFNGGDGANPQASLIFDAAGNLYGTTSKGGANGAGTVFRLIPTATGNWNEQVLHHFTGGKDGGQPMAGLVFDQAGSLYGTTMQGGVLSGCNGSGCGVVFKLAQNSKQVWVEQVLHRFTGGDGAQPFAGVILDQAGNLYGTTFSGGELKACVVSGQPSGCGVVFKLAANSKGGWNETVLHYFSDHPNGSHPAAGLIFDVAGNLYGTTAGNLPTNHGSVFEITP
jgi:uncharacterized repeat protein (TIGR03803 family)